MAALSLCGVCNASDDAVEPAAPLAVEGTKKQPAKPAAKPSAKPAAKPAAKPKAAKPAAKPKATKRVDVELSGSTSETSDQFHTRLAINRRAGRRQWFVKYGYGATVTRTYTKNKTNKTEIDTTTLDAQYRSDQKRTYNFVTAAAYIRNRSPETTTYGDLSGYYMLSAGVGRKLLPGLEGEFAVANVHRYEPDTGTQVQPACTLRLKTPVNDAITLDGESNFVDPLSHDRIVDSRINLTYKLTQALSLRMTYLANNLSPNPNSRSEWDRSFRVSLVFSRATQ